MTSMDDLQHFKKTSSDTRKKHDPYHTASKIICVPLSTRVLRNAEEFIHESIIQTVVRLNDCLQIKSHEYVVIGFDIIQCEEVLVTKHTRVELITLKKLFKPILPNLKKKIQHLLMYVQFSYSAENDHFSECQLSYSSTSSLIEGFIRDSSSDGNFNLNFNLSESEITLTGSDHYGEEIQETITIFTKDLILSYPPSINFHFFLAQKISSCSSGERS